MGTGSSACKTEKVQKDDKKVQKRRSSKGEGDVPMVTERDPPKGARKAPTTRRMSRSPTRVSAEFVPYEAEKLKLEGDWEIEKGVDNEIAVSELSYPAPRPGKLADKSGCTAVDFEILQRNSPKLCHKAFQDVATELTKGRESELLKVRALTTWISCQKIRTRQYGSEAKSETVAGYMKKIKESKGTFSGLLALLCRSIDIPCVIIWGIYKSANHNVGQDDVRDERCTWNAVYVDGSWQLIHPFLICTPLSNISPKGDWKMIESSREEPPSRDAAILNSFFFAPKPSDFVKLCLPDESISRWQLLEERVKYKQFINFPFLRPAFYDSKMELKSHRKCVILSEAGTYNIKIQCLEETVNDTRLMYELSNLDPDFELDPNWGNLVLCGRNEDTWNVQLKFPVDGTFKLSLFAFIYDWYFWIGDFKIICDVPYNNFVPQPSVPREVGFGPSRICENAGLLCPSHEGGIVFFKPKEEHVIKFLTKDKVSLRYEIESQQHTKEELHKYGRQINRKNETDFVITLPFRGEFALRIFQLNDKLEPTNVCNYLFTDADDSRGRENVFQRRARTNLRQATAGHEAEVLEKALEKFEVVRLSRDDDYVRGARRLRYLKLKRGLRDGRMRRHEETLRRAVEDAERSSFHVPLQKNIMKAKDMLADLESLEVNSHPVQQMDQKTIAEIANFNNPPRDVHNIMMATYLLLGENRQYLKKWGNIQGLLHRQGREGIKHRISEFQATQTPDQATIKAAQQLHDSVPKAYIMAASLSAAAFYDWVNGVLAYLNNTSQNAREAERSFETEDSGSVTDKRYHGNKFPDDDPGDMSQDEGFLDSHDFETNTSSSSRGNTHVN